MLALQLLRIETEGAYAALVAGSPSADAQEDAIRSASYITLPAAAHILAPVINQTTSLADRGINGRNKFQHAGTHQCCAHAQLLLACTKCNMVSLHRSTYALLAHVSGTSPMS